MREQYRLDCLGISTLPPKTSVENQRAVDIIDTSARRLAFGRFEVGLPWNIYNLVNIPDSYPQAFSRIKSLERQIAKDATLSAAYRDFVNGIISKGYAEECPPETYYFKTANISTSDRVRWYLPHFGVSPVPYASRFSVWLRLLRATACVILGARKFTSLLGNIDGRNSKLNFHYSVRYRACRKAAIDKLID